MYGITIHLGTIFINKFGRDSIHSFHLCLIWNSAGAVKGEIREEEEEKRMSKFSPQVFTMLTYHFVWLFTFTTAAPKPTDSTCSFLTGSVNIKYEYSFSSVDSN